MKRKQKIALLLSLQIFLLGCKSNTSSSSISSNNEIIIKNPTESVVSDDTTNNEVIPEEEIKETVVEPKNYIKLGYAYLTTDELFLVQKTNEVKELEKYQCVVVLNLESDTAYVITNDGDYGYLPISSIELIPDSFVEVDISDQTVNLYKDNELLLTTKTVTGKPSTPTNNGYFEIYGKSEDVYLTGPTWKSWVEYWMPFDGGRGLHDASWRGPDDFENSETYLTNGSHGCVNLPVDIASTIYENVEVGTKVLIHK